MLLLGASASDLIDIVTASAGDIEVDVSWVDVNTAAPPVVQDVESDALASITGAATTTILTGAASTKRRVKQIHVYNNDPSVSNLVTIRHNDASQTVVLCEPTLLPGELLLWDGFRWIHYDVNLGQYPQVGAMATQAEMEAAASLVVSTPPGRLHFHPGVAKCWGKAVGAGTSLTVNYNISSVADTGTGRLGVNIGTDFSSANYSIVASLERTVTALTATGVEDHAIRNASPAAGSFEIESYDQTAILFAAQDPQNYFWECFGDMA